MKFPLLVQFEFHPASTEAAAMAEHLRTVINDDAAVPGLRIPTCFTPDDYSLMPPEPRLSEEGDRVLVALLADDQIVAHARSGRNGLTWGDYAVRLRQLCDASPNHRFLPVQLTKFAWPVDTRLNDLSFLRAFDEPDEEQRKKLVARRLLHLLIRRLRPHATDEDAPPVTIFLSHAKVDVGKQPGVVNSLLDCLKAKQPEKTWFDSGDIASGSRFAKAIEEGVSDSALLAVVTDAYSSRSWCRREVLLAKRHQRPFVIVDALQEREVRRFPYAGNAPVLRWRDDPRDVVDSLLRETLRHAYAEEMLRQRARPGDDILPSGPELVTVVHRNKATPVLYPDPPLGTEELAVLSLAGVTVETPLERHANHLRLIEHMMADGVTRKLAQARSLRAVFELLRGYPSLGDFLAFQFAIDLNYGELVDFSEMEFVVAGPGARDGIRKCFKDTAGLTEAEVIEVVAERADAEFARLGLDFQRLWGRRLQLIDCQNIFCEVSKYARVAHPEVAGESGRTRIKQKFTPHPAPILQWYPPKWGLKVDAAATASASGTNIPRRSPPTADPIPAAPTT